MRRFWVGVRGVAVASVMAAAMGTAVPSAVVAGADSAPSLTGSACSTCPPPHGSGYHPLTPARILDSRTTTGGWNGRLTAGSPRAVPIAGHPGSRIPSSAAAVVMNVTATRSSSPSYLVVWPTGSVRPTASNLNVGPGQTIPNLVTSKLGVGGSVTIATAVGSVDVVADVVGYYDDGSGPGDRLTAIDPTRVLDSRGTVGGWGQQLVAATRRDLAVGSSRVPATATAVVANVTVVGSNAETFVRVWPSGEPEPGVSNLNVGPGQIMANLVMVKIGAGGKIAFSTAVGSTHVVVDVVGYFEPLVGSRFFPIDPTRVLDSRVPTGLSGPWAAGQTRDLHVAGAAGSGVPAGATGVIANVTVTDGTAQSLITVFPAGTPVPTASNLNFLAGQVIPNLAVVRVPASGSVSFFNDRGRVNLVADVVGYFAPPAPARPWSQLADWDHAWDAGEATRYVDDGVAYAMPSAVRVASVRDSAGTTPLLRDDGHYQDLFGGLPPAPGPLFDPVSSSFAGLPAWRSDVILRSSTFFDNYHSMLAPQTDKDDRSQWYGWNQPWWGAMLVAPAVGDGGHEDVAIDGDPGMTTMMLRPTVSMTTWYNMLNTGPQIDSGFAPVAGQSVLIVWQVHGTSSWIDVTYRDRTGVHTSHVTGAQGTGVLNVLHSGWSHMNATATLGFARGTCDPDTLDDIQDWAGPFLTAPAR